MCLFQDVDQGVAPLQQCFLIFGGGALSAGHLEETEQHLHLGIHVQIGIRERQAKLFERRIHLVLGVVVFGQGEPRHAVVRVFRQYALVERQGFFTASHLVVEFGQHAEVAHVLRIVLQRLL